MTFVEFHLLQLVEFIALLGSLLVSLEFCFVSFCIVPLDLILTELETQCIFIQFAVLLGYFSSLWGASVVLFINWVGHVVPSFPVYTPVVLVVLICLQFLISI